MNVVQKFDSLIIQRQIIDKFVRMVHLHYQVYFVHYSYRTVIIPLILNIKNQ